MVRVGFLCVVAAASADVSTGFVAPVSPAKGLIGSPRLSLSALNRGSALERAVVSQKGSRSRRRPLGLQMQEDGSMIGGGFNLSGEAPFEIRGFSLANLALLIGVGITGASFYEYFTSGGSAGLSGVGFVYGIPISLIGLALKTMRTVKKDVTRHRYGDEAHLDTTVKFLGLVMPRGDYPQLQWIMQTVEPNGELGFSMVWQSKSTPFKRWVEPERVQKYVSFFGPGVDAEVIKVDADERLVAIKLTTLPPGVSPTPKAAPPPPSAKEEPKAAEAAEVVAATPVTETEEAASPAAEA